MAGINFKAGPKMVHPEAPSAVGSRNSLNRDGRNEYNEGQMMIDEEVDKLINHVQEKLPPEVLQELNVMGNVKSHLHNYFNQSYQNMLNRYLVTAEDELSKKIRDMLDKEENKALNRYTPKEIRELVEQAGDPKVFNTGEVEKSMVNIMGHLQGHLAKGSTEFEGLTTHILMQRNDVGGLIAGENAYSILKASFKDHYFKPDTVMEVNVALNILDHELISAVVPYYVTTEALVKEIIAGQIHELIDREIADVNKQLEAEGRNKLSANEQVFEKIKALENHVDDDADDEDSKRYQYISMGFMERLKNMGAELDNIPADADGVTQTIVRFLKAENLHNRGWSSAVNNLTRILDDTRLGYQYVENLKDTRRLSIREYEQTDISRLPDERYNLSLRYLTREQLVEDQIAYSAQISEFRREVMRLWDVVQGIYHEEKAKQKLRDWDDVVNSTLSRRGRGGAGWFEPGKEGGPQWNEITFIQRKLTNLEEMNQTYAMLVTDFQERFRIVRRRLNEIFDTAFPEHRMVVEQRLNFLETQFSAFMAEVNPYHIQPGLVLDLRMTSIKRGKTTVKMMANVLNHYLMSLSKDYVMGTVGQSHRHANVGDAMGSFGEA
ncbi:MAG: cytoplasmic filament protein CfpA [Deltaproteobacteria bacterium]|nr:cytoplasmic filament protein CfpA [Deltaproteobacteria bacterium]